MTLFRGFLSTNFVRSLVLGTSFCVAVVARVAGGDLSARFARYTEHDPTVPVYVMPSDRTIHRFFGASPISPSGRYLALFRLPYESHSPRPGDSGEVLVIDLHSGQQRTIARSRGWETQVGANVQWGCSDAELFFNDVDPRTWKAFAVRVDPATKARRDLQGTIFEVSPAGITLASHNLVKSRRVMPGYGVVVPDERVGRNVGPVVDDGVYLTDTASGKSCLLVSLQTIYDRAVPSIRVEDPRAYEYYCFQVKWNSQGTRLLVPVFWIPLSGGKRGKAVITLNADGSDIRTAITADQWARGGHHINWCPDGVHLSMNLNIDNDPALELVTVRYDGGALREVFEPGSGHPSFRCDGRYIIADAYPHEPVAYGDGSVPIRLIDTNTATCRNIVRIYVSDTTGQFRVDPHPAWDASGRYVVFNGFVGDTRRVYIADLSGL
jgi:hypothetical protein